MIKKIPHVPAVMPVAKISPVLFHIKGKLPFDLVPDELIIKEKIIIIKRHFFPFITTVTTIPMGKLINFEVSRSYMYSSIHIKASSVVDTVFSWLDNNDAREAKELIDGIRIARNEPVIIRQTEKRYFIQTLKLMGQM